MWRTKPKLESFRTDDSSSSGGSEESLTIMERRTPTPKGSIKSGVSASGSTKTGATVPSRFVQSQGGLSGSIDHASDSTASGYKNQKDFRDTKLRAAAVGVADKAPGIVGASSPVSGQSTSGQANKTSGAASAKSYSSLPGGRSGKAGGSGTAKGSQKKW